MASGPLIFAGYEAGLSCHTEGKEGTEMDDEETGVGVSEAILEMIAQKAAAKAAEMAAEKAEEMAAERAIAKMSSAWIRSSSDGLRSVRP